MTTSTLIQSNDRLHKLRRMRNIASIMDAQFNVMGFKIGLDSVIGLIPWLGDVIAAIIAAYIIFEAYTIGIPKEIIAKMMGNVVLDMVIGGIPIIGDVFDILFKANLRNMRMVEAYVENEKWDV